MEIYGEGSHMNNCGICGEFITLHSAFCKLLQLHKVLEEVNTQMVKVLVSTRVKVKQCGSWRVAQIMCLLVKGIEGAGNPYIHNI